MTLQREEWKDESREFYYYYIYSQNAWKNKIPYFPYPVERLLRLAQGWQPEDHLIHVLSFHISIGSNQETIIS